jgi:hypothetical protein
LTVPFEDRLEGASVMRRLCIVLVVLGGWLVSTTAPAAAAPPSSTRHVVGTDGGLYISCQGFDVWFSADYEATFTDFHDGSGDVVRSTMHLQFSGTLYNEANPSRSLPYQGIANFTWFGDTLRATGTYVAWIDGKPVQLETGLALVDNATGDVTLHGLWQDALLCVPLA